MFENVGGRCLLVYLVFGSCELNSLTGLGDKPKAMCPLNMF